MMVTRNPSFQVTQLRQLLSKRKPSETDFSSEFNGICHAYNRYNPYKSTRLGTMRWFCAEVK